MHPLRFSQHQRLSEWPDCSIEIRCQCQRTAQFPVRLLIEQHGDLAVRNILPRLVCRECHAQPVAAWFVAGMHRSTYGGPEPDWAVELVKPG